MGIFSGISEAFHSVADSITDAYDSFSEKIHDVFYTPSYEKSDISVSKIEDKAYDTWIIEQGALDFGVWTDYADVFAEGGTP
jgi:hypothetical protein